MKREYIQPIIIIHKCCLKAGVLLGAASNLADDSETLAPMAHGSLFDDDDDLSLGEEKDW